MGRGGTGDGTKGSPKDGVLSTKSHSFTLFLLPPMAQQIITTPVDVATASVRALRSFLRSLLTGNYDFITAFGGHLKSKL